MIKKCPQYLFLFCWFLHGNLFLVNSERVIWWKGRSGTPKLEDISWLERFWSFARSWAYFCESSSLTCGIFCFIFSARVVFAMLPSRCCGATNRRSLRHVEDQASSRQDQRSISTSPNNRRSDCRSSHSGGKSFKPSPPSQTDRQPD